MGCIRFSIKYFPKVVLLLLLFWRNIIFALKMLMVKPVLLLAPTPCRTLSSPPLSLTCPATLISPLPPPATRQLFHCHLSLQTYNSVLDLIGICINLFLVMDRADKYYMNFLKQSIRYFIRVAIYTTPGTTCWYYVELIIQYFNIAVELCVFFLCVSIE